MAGKTGFEHNCQNERVSKSENKKSLMESPYSHAQIDMLWDFYVSHAISGGSGLERTITDYGWNNDTNKETGQTAIFNSLIESAGLRDNICFIRSKTCKNTLSAMGLSGDMICASHPRAVLLQSFGVSTDENDTPNVTSSESRIDCIFRHIRNAFAHGNTYFFENGFVLLEDKDKNNSTAMIIVSQQTLLDWIRIIDRNERFYTLVD